MGTDSEPDRCRADREPDKYFSGRETEVASMLCREHGEPERAAGRGREAAVAPRARRDETAAGRGREAPVAARARQRRQSRRARVRFLNPEPEQLPEQTAVAEIPEIGSSLASQGCQSQAEAGWSPVSKSPMQQALHAMRAMFHTFVGFVCLPTRSHPVVGGMITWPPR